ncbi:MAG: epoxyqueuosine reductase [Proteobacteria bacterium]|nr:epoxyqueuosine reductase [Pseudomonadota bacterium]MBU1581852.1 epoxyqueuosine reductase [Pseudomonadota bacterium]MBU2452561.1 epoxyqueuosine reductase [Pseudomonadota bacterium]MBU2634841.1 epoxyqueuosine reductase [Nanoarchaeota archaeon]
MATPVTSGELREFIEKYTADYPRTTGLKNYWRAPLLVTATADKRFDILPEIAADDHALPKELLATGKTVIVFFVPFIKELAKENHKGDIPCRNWGLAYEATNTLINTLCEQIKLFFEHAGYCSALVPATHNFDHKKLMARWSHKHLGYIAGLGRFGVNAQFITPKGCAGRLGSLVTEADLGDSPLVGETELCLYKNGHNCLACVKRCPVGAVSAETGIDRKKCWARLKSNLHETKELAGLEKNSHVCGKCQVLVPCSLNIPKG